MRFVFEQIRTGGDRNFAYLVGDRQERVAVIVDPSYDPDGVVERATAQGLSVEYIINTHGHPDHTNGNGRARELTGAPLAAYRESRVSPDVKLGDGDELEVGSVLLRFTHVPGHCDDHLLIHLPREKVALTGDLIFVGKIGGTDSDDAARLEFESLRKALGELPDETTIWPGHDYGCRPSSTVALEKATNPFLLAADIDAFLDLKAKWSSFKAERGLR
ncbi:MAG: hydroxyacylglutathione hydrolase family protein [Planctomycetota bacterium]|nr:hydroxyacylglutathione hydrolase family protein [Planctomycetota bacterium]